MLVFRFGFARVVERRVAFLTWPCEDWEAHRGGLQMLEESYIAKNTPYTKINSSQFKTNYFAEM